MATSKVPLHPAPLHFQFPAYQRRTLSNGLKLIVVEDPTQPLVSVQLSFLRGSAGEPVWGAANCMASLLTRGTASRSAQDIASAIDFTGGTLSAHSGFDSTSLYLSVLRRFLPDTVSLLQDVACQPSFAAEELERVRQQTLVEIQQYLSDPGYLAAVAFTQGMFRGTPYGFPTIGTLDSLPTIQRETIVQSYHAAFRPDRAFIAAAGAIEADELSALLEPLFGSWMPDSEPTPDLPAIDHKQQTEPVVMFIEKPGAAQTALRIGFRTISRLHPDYIALQCVNTILGGSFISRLNHNLREDKGYTYGIHSSIESYNLATFWVARTHVGSDVVRNAVQEIMDELKRLATQPVTPEELETTKNYILGSFALRTETPQQVVHLLHTLESLGLPDDYYERYFETIRSMTTEQLFAVQQRHLSSISPVIALSGDVERLRRELDGMGIHYRVFTDCRVEKF